MPLPPLQSLRIAAAQTPVFWEDVDGAMDYAAGVIAEAEAAGAVLLCFPECFLQGYLVGPQAARRHALDLASPAFAQVLARLPASGPTVVMGLIEAKGERVYNAAVVVQGGRLIGRYRKRHLLGGEAVFTPGQECPVFEADGLRFGVAICYDTNFPDAARLPADQGATLLLCPANNMMRRQTAEAWKHRHNPIRGERCREAGLWLMSADVTGARGDRIAWGPTAVLSPDGAVAAQLALDAPGLLIFDLSLAPPA